ncbi:MAG: hypothetical protein HN742_34385 [Lentisphaerae bacterium]|nr:hypothetical protein [Lentisphaerota bacterium]MBT4822194.1 hypothetical protein [Lentisphaerota bacterium]MBT5605047.1 hypothetical protein [Lentisphaerota bacterium]MBT7058669.1 hypothetical protein [Lentisphaerota bacterium]MBT7847010.1 hypothetical protein [Lentisphaerota bacterium]
MRRDAKAIGCLCRGLHTFRLAVVISVCLWRPVSAWTSTCRDRAVEFLVEAQGAAGLWSLGTERWRVDSEAVLAALEGLSDDRALGGLLQGRAALLAALPDSPRHVRDSLAELRLLSSARLSDLLGAMNADGGWGGVPGHVSNPIDTVNVVDLLVEIGQSPEPGWSQTIIFLDRSRSPDGWWGLTDEPAPGALLMTARVLRGLIGLQASGAQHASLPSLIADTRDLVLRQRQSDGGFAPPFEGEVPVSSVHATAAVLRALCRIDPPGTHADSLRFLLSRQQLDGGWREGDLPDTAVYVTAVMVDLLKDLALPALPTLPDLAVVRAGISFAPAAPRPADVVRIQALVFNRGDSPSAATSLRFALGDPRAGVDSIVADVSLPGLQPGTSALLSTSVDTAGFSESPLIGVAADPANLVPEADETNNVALCRMEIEGVSVQPSPEGVDLCLGLAGITVNGQSPETPISLSESRTVLIGIGLANTGTVAATDVAVEVRDGGVLVGRGAVPSVLPNGAGSWTFLWRPQSGTHALDVTLDPQDAIPELDETNNAGSASVDVTMPVSSLSVQRLVDGAALAPPFFPYDTARISVSSAHAAAVTTVSVRGVNGEAVSIAPVPLSTPGDFQWSIANQPPGDYTVAATLASATTGAVLMALAETVGVLPRVAMRAPPRVLLSRTSMEPGELDPVSVTVILQNGGNTDAEWHLGWAIVSPAGMVVAASAQEQSTVLPATQMTRMVSLDEPLTGTVELPGSYRVVVTARHDTEPGVTGEALLAVEPGLRLQLANRLYPARTEPVSVARITTELRLTAVDTSGAVALPAAIGAVVVSPSSSLRDAADATVTLRAEGIVNGLGEAVPDGTFIALHAPYGTLTGGTPLPIGGSTKLRLFVTDDGAITASYTPAGDALIVGSSSVLVLRFLQCTNGAAGALGREIGHQELQLIGVNPDPDMSGSGMEGGP